MYDILLKSASATPEQAALHDRSRTIAAAALTSSQNG
jgi:hypothetical protein